MEAVFQDNSEGRPWHIGFVCHHGDMAGLEVLRWAAGIGGNGMKNKIKLVATGGSQIWTLCSSIGMTGTAHTVRDVSSLCRLSRGKKVDVEGEDFDGERYYRSLVQGRFMLLDAQGFPDLIQALMDGERIEQRNYVVGRKHFSPSGSLSLDSKSSGDDNPFSNCGDFGTHLVVPNSEYDMGWMAFQNGELVGFVSDGAYSRLEGDRLRIQNNLVTAQ